MGELTMRADAAVGRQLAMRLVPETVRATRDGLAVCRCGEVHRYASAFARCDASGVLVDGTPDGDLATCLVCGLIVDCASFDAQTSSFRVVGEASAYGVAEPVWPPRDDAVRGAKLAVVHHGATIPHSEPGDVLVAVFSHDRRLAVTAAIRLVARRTGRAPNMGGPRSELGGWWSITQDCQQPDSGCFTWRDPENDARSWCGRIVPPGTPGAVPITTVLIRPQAPRAADGARQHNPTTERTGQMAPRRPHTLHVRREPGADPDEVTYSITCPEPASYDRPCVMFLPCGCDDIVDDNQPCPKSPTGRHEYIETIAALGHRTLQCYPANADRLHEAASELGLAPGDYAVDWDCPEASQLDLELVDRECVDEHQHSTS